MRQPDDALFLRKAEDKALAAEKFNYPTHTGFLDLHQQSLANEALALPSGIGMVLYGGYPDSERQMAVFVPGVFSGMPLQELVPVAVLHMMASPADGAVPGHRDYLGAVLGLGISRDRLGDILVEGNGAYLFCDRELAGFIMDNLLQAGRSSVRVEEVDGASAASLVRRYELLRGTVASNRLDNLVKLAGRMSRTQAAALIKAGKVAVNGKVCQALDIPVGEGRILSIRGIGKFKLASASARTKKDRIAVELHQYI